MFKVIQLLSDGLFHSGEELGKVLNITRSGVWKLIQQLQKKWNIEVESRTGKGYRIPQGIQLLNTNTIKKYIEANPLSELGPIEIFQTLHSTNDYLMELANEKTSEASSSDRLIKTCKNSVCIAEHQSKGKGRRGRDWVSPFGQNIYLSMLWHFTKDFSEVSGLSLAIAVAVLKTIQKIALLSTTTYIANEHSTSLDNQAIQWPLSSSSNPKQLQVKWPLSPSTNPKQLQVKWPNDVLWDGKKIAGILIELSGETCNISRAVVGIGLNIAMSPGNGKKISQPWTDLTSLMNGAPPDRNLIAGMLINELVKTFKRFQENGLKPFLEPWIQHDIAYLKPIELHTPQGIIKGIHQGINEQGHLLIKTEDNTIKSFSSGEISLRLD